MPSRPKNEQEAREFLKRTAKPKAEIEQDRVAARERLKKAKKEFISPPKRLRSGPR